MCIYCNISMLPSHAHGLGNWNWHDGTESTSSKNIKGSSATLLFIQLSKVMILSVNLKLVILLGYLVVVSADYSYDSTSVQNSFPNLTSCLLEPSFFSCENTTTIKNTCCSPTPGGLVLQTQFWSTYTGRENKGQLLPKGSWTIHGLWPDNCDGFFLLFYRAVTFVWWEV